MNEAEWARRQVSRAHGRPMVCPTCGNDVYIDVQHICPPGFVKPARKVRYFYNYRSMNECCRSWLLLGMPEERTEDSGVLTVKCKRCGKDLHFDIPHPDAVISWNEALQGKPDPPTIIAGRIR